MNNLTIGKAAKTAGIGVETIRFYERKGLIDQPPRRESGYRQYSSDVIPRLRFIKRAKELGFSLKEIQALLELKRNPETTCAEIKQRSEEKIMDIEGRIRDLQSMLSVLQNLSTSCKGSGPLGDCPILGALDHENINLEISS